MVLKLNVDAEKVVSFDCGRHATYLLMANGKQDKISMDAENPDATGLLHFYQEEHPEKEIDGKKLKVWKFMTEQEYASEESKNALPDICFATRHKIKGLANRLKKIKEGNASDEDWLNDCDLPDLQSLIA